MPARVSLKEIAATVGLSVASVSEILNNRPNNYSSEATKERVRRVAKEIGVPGQFRLQAPAQAENPHRCNHEFKGADE